MNSLIRNLAMFTVALIAIILMVSHGSDAKRLKRFHGGRTAWAGKYTWVVSIGYKVHRNHICGGAIIDKDYVLTAAHCVKNAAASELIVRSGSIDLRKTVSSDVAEIIKHHDYRPKAGLFDVGPHDIAILKLEQSLELGVRLSRIPLPKKDRKEINATFAGWGAISEIPHVVSSPLLQIARMMVISDNECQKWNRPGLRPQYICVYHPTGAVLRGDSGGPLTYRNEIIGIASTGPRVIGVPSYFTNVHHYVGWINQAINAANEV